MTRATSTPRRARDLLLLLVLLLGACATRPRFAAAARSGDVVTFWWAASEPRPGAEGLTYELCVWSAQDGLPREEWFRVTDLTETSYEKSGVPLDAEQVWSVRARYHREGRPCASEWYAPAPVPWQRVDSARVPLRGLPVVPMR